MTIESLVPVTVNGQPILVHAETTTGPILEQYASHMAVFNELFNASSEIVETQILSGAYNARIQASIVGLNNIAANGVVNPELGAFNNPQRLNFEMAKAMNRLYETLTIAGIPVDGSAVSTQQVLNWRNISYSSSGNTGAVQDILTAATNAVGKNNASMQSLVQLVYVQQGNDIITANLVNLEQALSTTNEALMTLSKIQYLANQKTATSKQTFRQYLQQRYPGHDPLIAGFPGAPNPSSNGAIMAGNASAFFGGILPPEVSDALNNSINPYILQFLDYRDQLAKQIQTLSAITPDPGNPQSLLGTLKAVYSTMNTAINVNGGNLPGALRTWILDGQTVSGDTVFGPSGSIQIKINNAMTAGQNLNSKQTEQTRQYLFLFEQFYQSASSILATLSQVITSMAKSAGR